MTSEPSARFRFSRNDHQVARIEFSPAVGICLDDVFAAVGQRGVDVGPLRLTVLIAEQDFQVVADDHRVLRHDQSAGNALPHGDTHVHTVGQRPVVADLGVDLHLSVFVDRGIDGQNAAPNLFAQIGEPDSRRPPCPDAATVFGFEYRKPNVETTVVEQGAELPFRFFIDLLFHVGYFPRKRSPQRTLLQTPEGAPERSRSIGVARADTRQLYDFGRRSDGVAERIALPHEHIEKSQPGFVQGQLRLVQLKGVFRRIEPGDQTALPHPGAIFSHR